MRATDGKGQFSAAISQQLIDEALKSVDRRAGGAAARERTGAAAALEGEVASDRGEGESASQSASTSDPAEATERRTPVERAATHELEAQLETSLAHGRDLLAKFKLEHEKMLRAAADLDNFKKRAQREREEQQRFGSEKLLRDLLPVLDNFDRALEHARGPSDYDTLRKGVVMIRRLFEDALAKHGARPFAAKGQPFDPSVHEAMSQTETSELPPNHVVSDFVRGFKLHDRLLRPALVIVSKSVPQPASAPQAAREDQAPSGAGPPVEASCDPARPGEAAIPPSPDVGASDRGPES